MKGIAKVGISALSIVIGFFPVAASLAEPVAGAALPTSPHAAAHIAPRMTAAISDLHAPIVGIAATVDDKGYWLAAADGGVFTYGDAPFYGSLGGSPLNSPIVGIATSGTVIPGVIDGYWLVAADGGVFTFGAAPFYGSLGGARLDAPIVGIVPYWEGALGEQAFGYWLVAADGGVFTFGNLPFPGSLAGQLSSPLTAVTTSTEFGFEAALADGEVFTFTDQPGISYAPADGFYSYSLYTKAPSVVEPVPENLPSPIVAITLGLTLADASGGISNYGSSFYGSASTLPRSAPIVAMRATSPDAGYWIVAADGSVYCFGNAPFYGSATGVSAAKRAAA